jgi:hypothetical protein
MSGVETTQVETLSPGAQFIVLFVIHLQSASRNVTMSPYGVLVEKTRQRFRLLGKTLSNIVQQLFSILLHTNLSS